MLIYGIGATQAIDSSGEILSVEGCDISDVAAGKAFFNWEHSNDGADTIVGAVTYAKKIYSLAECENDKQKECWEACLLPMVYIEGRLFDKEGHVGAICLAAMFRSFAARGEKIQIGTSIEGATMQRGQGPEHNILMRTLARRWAITLRPCNKQCMLYLDKDEYPDVLKSETFNFMDIAPQDVPAHGFINIEDPIADIYNTIAELNKTLDAGGGATCAPSQLVGGAALGVENLVGSTKDRIKNAYKKWDRKKSLKAHMKAELPDVAEKYIEHFDDIANELQIKKSEGLIRIESDKQGNDGATASQKALLNGTSVSANGSPSRIATNDNGQVLDIYSSSITPTGGETAKNAASYYAAADDVFGLGDHVTPTAFFLHQTFPMDGAPLHYAVAQPEGQSALIGKTFEDSFGKNKELYQKIGLMDAILGHGHRICGNILLNKGKPILMDNHHAFEYNQPSGMHQKLHGGDIMGEDTRNWLMSIDPKKLAGTLASSKIGLDRVKKAITALKIAQAHNHHPIDKIVEKIYHIEMDPVQQ